MKKIDSFYVIPKYTFFDWGFTVPQKYNSDFIELFRLNAKNLVEKIDLIIEGKIYPAKIRMARINNRRKFEGRSSIEWTKRKVIQIYYDKEYSTLNALRDLFIYSYAITIDGSKPESKEVLEFIHLKKNKFKINPVSRNRSPFDSILKSLSNRNLLYFCKDKNTKDSLKNQIIIGHSQKWLDAKEINKYINNQNNALYLLYHSGDKQIYIGKANILSKRVKLNEGRRGLKDNWDKFMWFEINPRYGNFLIQLESFLIRTFASILENDVKVTPIEKSKIKLVNRQLLRTKI